MKNVLKENTQKEPENNLLQDVQEYGKKIDFIRQINSSYKPNLIIRLTKGFVSFSEKKDVRNAGVLVHCHLSDT